MKTKNSQLVSQSVNINYYIPIPPRQDHSLPFWQKLVGKYCISSRSRHKVSLQQIIAPKDGTDYLPGEAASQ